MTYKVLIPQDIVEDGKNWLRERGCEIVMGSGTSVDAICRDVADCDAILVRTAQYPAEVMRAGPKLKVISRFGVGTDNIDVAEAERMGIWVTIAGTANYNTVAEQALACIVALGRRMTFCENRFRAGNFEIRNTAKPIDIEGKTLGVLGLGKIGRALADKARLGLGMRILGYDPYLPADRVPEGIEMTGSWDEAFSRPDFVSLHMPSTGKAIVGAKEFALMKPTAYFVNLARGDLVDEAALVEALRTKSIAGAGLDVFAQEPPSGTHPLFGFDDVILTPHNAGLTVEAMRRVSLQAAQGIWEVLSGQEPTWPVNHPSHPRQ